MVGFLYDRSKYLIFSRSGRHVSSRSTDGGGETLVLQTHVSLRKMLCYWLGRCGLKLHRTGMQTYIYIRGGRLESSHVQTDMNVACELSFNFDLHKRHQNPLKETLARTCAVTIISSWQPSCLGAHLSLAVLMAMGATISASRICKATTQDMTLS